MKIIKLWNTVKVILKGKFMALGAYIKKWRDLTLAT